MMDRAEIAAQIREANKRLVVKLTNFYSIMELIYEDAGLRLVYEIEYDGQICHTWQGRGVIYKDNVIIGTTFDEKSDLYREEREKYGEDFLNPIKTVAKKLWDNWDAPVQNFHAFIARGNNPQSRIFLDSEIPAWDSSELEGFENIFVGSLKDCQQSISDEIEHRRQIE